VRESRRKKLESKGWRIGTPKEFLGMTDEEEAYVNLRLKLAEGPRTRRHARCAVSRTDEAATVHKRIPDGAAMRVRTY